MHYLCTCGETRFEFVSERVDARGRRFEIYRCRSCGAMVEFAVA